MKVEQTTKQSMIIAYEVENARLNTALYECKMEQKKLQSDIQELFNKEIARILYK